MTQIITRLAEVAPRYRALFCDLWGCVHDGIAAFPAAVAALQAFRAGGGRVILVTNAPRPKSGVVRQLARLGVPPDAWDDIATSGDAAQAAMVLGAVGRAVHHIGPAKDEAFFTDFAEDVAQLAAAAPPITRVPLEIATGIVCTGPFDELTETPGDYRATLLRAKAMGLKLLCANPDLVVDLGDKRIYCAGALAQLYDEMGGISLYFGKPHPPIYDLARRRLAAIDPALTDADILCIGDNIATDIQGGMAEGLDTLFVASGLASASFGPDSRNPDKGLLDSWLTGQTTTPTLAIGTLR